MIRPMILPISGWYPASAEECKSEIIAHTDNSLFLEGLTPKSAVVPHAGWFFCGRLAANTIRILKEKNGIIKNVVIFGGHLAEANIPVIETFEAAETPFGRLENNKEILEHVTGNFLVQSVPYLQDNTIEILLPLVHYYFGDDIKITAIYLPPNKKAEQIAELINEKAEEETVFIGSTDLTHYGPNYSFYYKDKKRTPVEWVKEVNDKGYIDLLLAMEGAKSVEYSVKKRAACSPGAAYGALHAGLIAGAKEGHLIGYSTSYDIHKSESFVGYAGIIF